MISKNIENVLNEQVEKEFYSSNLYLAMAVWAETNGLVGVSKWLYEQAAEEHIHMLKFVSYINDRGGKAIIPAIKQPPSKFKDLKTVFNQVLEHEKYISKSINNIVGIAFEEKDFSTNTWLNFFVEEQLEEESSVQEIIDRLNLIGENNLYLFDRDILSMRAK
jgi:ferritin